MYITKAGLVNSLINPNVKVSDFIVILFFSLGKHFEKEEDVRGIPQESVHFRCVHVFPCLEA